ncbi:MAG TPA: HEAT repeat domain-containing protein, partial [Pirellulaceae bacterium]|nr:HEAT repeat domain-containing protein [Pirellulaceae bacterium]
MRCAVVFLLMVGAWSEGVRADEAEVYRGQTAEQWLQQLSHPSASARAAAAQAFVTMGQGNENAVDPLIGLLSDRDELVRFYAAYALGKIGTRHEQCIQALLDRLPDKDEHVRYTAQWSLAEIAKQIASSTDADMPADEALASLLVETETQLLAAGALPGHLHQIRTAIARGQQSTSRDESREIERCLQSLASGEAVEQAKAIQTLRRLGPKCVEQLFASPDVIAKLDTAGWQLPSAIASLGEPVIPVLMKALRQPDFEISDLAARTLRKLGPLSSSALPELIELLENEETSDDMRQRAIGIMIDMGPAAVAAMDLLVQTLNDINGDEDLQRTATEALGAIGPDARDAVPALIERLTDAQLSPNVQGEIASALALIDPKSEDVTESLVAAFQKTENIVDAIAIAEKLSVCGPGAIVIVPRLMEAIDETSFDHRAAVLRLLCKLGSLRTGEVTPLLFERLMDPTEEQMVRVAAAKAIGSLGPAAVQLVIDELQHGDEPNQLIAARTLVEIGSAASPAKDALHQALIEPRAANELRSLAAVALGQLGSQASDAAPALTELLRDPESDSYLRSMCAVALGQVDPTAAPILESILHDSEPEVQIASAYSLCKIDQRHAGGLATLVRWLASDEYRESAMSSLIDVGEASLAVVVETMNDASQHREARVACLQVVGAFHDRGITPLLQALNDPGLAEEAGFALRDRGNELLPTLVASIEDEANFTPQARDILANVVEDMFSGLGGGAGEDTWEGGHPLVRLPESAPMEMAAAMEAAEQEMAAAMELDAASGRAMTGARMSPTPSTSPKAAMAMPPEPMRSFGAGGGATPAETKAQVDESPLMPEGYKTVDVFYGTNR